MKKLKDKQMSEDLEFKRRQEAEEAYERWLEIKR